MKKYITQKPYQAKVQIRPFNEKVYSFVKQSLKIDGAEITDEFKRKEGLDVLVSSSRAAFSLAKKFKKKFDGETKITNSLVGEDKQVGKRIYRLTVLLRLKEKPL
ncbi:60S ribosomal export protein NMD3 [archaeon]|nr:60S ribosomal export protein NMD3 [archaeon]